MKKEVLCKVINSAPKVEGIDRAKESELRSRKNKKQHRTEVDKWKEVYRILFPEEHEIPSACEKMLKLSAKHDANRTFQSMAQLRSE